MSTKQSDDKSDDFSEADRRESGRVQISTEVTLKTVDNLTASGSDLSVGGIYVVTPGEIPVGSLVEVEFTVEGIQREFELLGEVKWSQPQPRGESVHCGLGIEFLNLEPEEREALRDFVSRRDPLEPPAGAMDD